MSLLSSKFTRRTILISALLCSTIDTADAAPIKIGYSDWPGWVAWQIAIDKGWIKQAGIDASFQWFDYSASLEAFAAGKLDAVLATNGDTLVTGSAGGRGTMILATDYSSGNDMIIGKAGIKSLKDLMGQSVAVETGLVDHLLLINGLKKAGIAENAIKLVNAKTNELPQILASGSVSAIGVWQPVAGQALKASAGAHPLYTSADEPGLIYDVLTVSPNSLNRNRADWIKLTQVWDKVVTYINDPKTQPDALKIMAQRSGGGITPESYKKLLYGTHLLNIADNQAVMVKAKGFKSLYGSSYFVDKFNVNQGIYRTAQNVDGYIDPKLVHGK
ncbi:ABC transporter substrate-binding protein [Aquirhabdus sp.]|uniref:ABC transporter substrate-binding protein n=1 Tax=Aquirhabdus sp. TaxID=2824160 RepID=UPI00396CEB5B